MTRWVDTRADFENLLGVLIDQPVVALDTEFHRERTYHPHLALVQLAWGAREVQEIALVDATTVELHSFERV
ncbi:MAG TPA: hypothetical protein VGZ52_06500, partial [Acidimicrobiales bacterium]|nr:hypothetical protein [Acidimicrobiales bacterium]